MFCEVGGKHLQTWVELKKHLLKYETTSCLCSHRFSQTLYLKSERVCVRKRLLMGKPTLFQKRHCGIKCGIDYLCHALFYF